MANARVTDSNGDDYDVLVLAGSQSVPRAWGAKLAPITRPGADGHEYLRVGTRPEAFRVELFRDAGSASEARNHELYFKRMEGTLISYRDELGYTWDSVLVLRVRCQRRITPAGTGFVKSAGESEHGLFASMLLELTSQPAAE